MDISGPIMLWKDYDVAALPLNVTELSPKTENGRTVRQFYFDGYITVDGKVRTYIEIAEHPEPKGVVLYIPDKRAAARDIAEKLFDYGYSVATLDYLGVKERGRYTLYPQSLNHCNLREAEQFTATGGIQLSNWYIWTCLARRAVRLLHEQSPEAKLFALGVGLGGTTVYKLASFEDGLTACATLLNILPTVVGEGNSLINYHASLDNYAYALISKVPVFMGVASNDSDGSLDDMAELAANTQSLDCFRIVERSFADGIKSVYGELDKYFCKKAADENCLPQPEISPSNSEGNLYLNIDIPDDLPDDTQLKLYVSFCTEKPEFRNWMMLPTISLGKEKYMALINVCQNEKPIFAFANLTGADGEVQSSPLFTVVPKSIGVKQRVGVSHRKIYDGSMGIDGWSTRDGGEIMLVPGPFDIEGVTSSTHSLITFKLGDPLFRVPADTILQLMICGKPQTVTVTVRDKTTSYTYNAVIQNSEDWSKFSLAHHNFKSESGQLADWSNVIMLEFTSSDEYIIGSVLWI